MQKKQQARTFNSVKATTETSYSNVTQMQQKQQTKQMQQTRQMQQTQTQPMISELSAMLITMNQMMDMINKIAKRLEEIETRSTGTIPKQLRFSQT